jgi:integrase
MSRVERFDSSIGPSINQYLTLKRALGRQCRFEHDVYRHLDQFLLEHCAESPDLAPSSFAAWSRTLIHLTSGVRRNRMRVVRNLCLYRRRTQPECFVPDSTQFPLAHQPITPYIFSDSEIVRLLHGAATLEPTSGAPLRPAVYHLATVLLYTTGMRRGELVRMALGDYDPRERTLLVRHSKFHKSRLLPLSDDAVSALEDFLEACRLIGRPLQPETPLLWNRLSGGRHYSGGGLGQGFRRLFNASRIHTMTGRTPRVHDLRHTFAVTVLLRWYREGVDVQTRLPALSTYMGHISIASTQYYLQFVDELAGHASKRFADLCAGLVTVEADTR